MRTRDTQFRSLLAELESRAVASGVPHQSARRAAEATGRKFSDLGESPDRRARARVRAYFHAVVRNSLIRDPEGSKAVSSRILDAVVHDLRRSGRDDASIAEELRRGWAGMVDPVVLLEYELRLCPHNALLLAG